VSDRISSDEEQRLCNSCALCCNGALFRYAPLDPSDDVNALLASNLEIQQQSGRQHLLQPCRALLDTKCGVYSIRPAVCRAYRCRLLRRFAEQEVRWEAALRIVQHARELYQKLITELPPDTWEILESGTGLERLPSELLMDVGELKAIGSRYFINERQVGAAG
jgi:hypothetical protein